MNRSLQHKPRALLLLEEAARLRAMAGVRPFSERT
jgi:hypothetical protein